jgi:hypothetical protein
MLDKEKLFEGIKKGSVETAKNRRTIEQAIALLEAQNEKTRQQRDRLTDLYTLEEITLDEFKRRKQKLEAEIAKREEERNDHEAKLGRYPVISKTHEVELQRFSDEISKRMSDDMSFEDKQRLLEILNIQVSYDYRTQEAKISGGIGKHTVSITSSCTPRSPCRRPWKG